MPSWCSPGRRAWRCCCATRTRASTSTPTGASPKTWCCSGERCPPLLVGCVCVCVCVCACVCVFRFYTLIRNHGPSSVRRLKQTRVLVDRHSHTHTQKHSVSHPPQPRIRLFFHRTMTAQSVVCLCLFYFKNCIAWIAVLDHIRTSGPALWVA